MKEGVREKGGDRGDDEREEVREKGDDRGDDDRGSG